MGARETVAAVKPASTGRPPARPHYEALGRLPVFGLTQPWHAAFLLPLRFDDFSAPASTFGAVPLDERAAFWLTVSGAPRSVCRNGVPRLNFELTDTGGRSLRATMFGDTRAVERRLRPGEPVCLIGTVKAGEQQLLFSANEVIDPEWVGRLRPVYPSKANVIGADKVRERVLALLDEEMPRAVAYLTTQLARAGAHPQALLEELGCPGWTYAQLLEQAHRPRDRAYATHVHGVLVKIAALVGLSRAQAATPPTGAARALRLPALDALLRSLPAGKTPTSDQRDAIARFAVALGRTRAARAMLSGDVGTGKHLALAAIAVAAAEEGARVAILLPNIVLAGQFDRELRELFPAARTAVITGATRRGGASPDAPILIGTTALIARELGQFDLVIVDENHKFSREQREHHVGPNTHSIEATATCLPRSLALAKFGVTELALLRAAPFPKTIHTALWTGAQVGELFARVRETIAAGDQVLVVYPERGEEESAGAAAVRSAFARWAPHFPGRVRALTGADSDDTKIAVVADLLERRADLVLSTVVIECGLNAPGLRRVVIVHPERFGAAQLHQIRGRVARLGGEGWCDLLCPTPLTERARHRVEVLLEHADGFSLAEADMRLRGFGDLSPKSRKQSGADDSIVFGQPLTLEAIESILPLWTRLCARSEQ